jgi:hypothetical protein
MKHVPYWISEKNSLELAEPFSKNIVFSKIFILYNNKKTHLFIADEVDKMAKQLVDTSVRTYSFHGIS